MRSTSSRDDLASGPERRRHHHVSQNLPECGSHSNFAGFRARTELTSEASPQRQHRQVSIATTTRRLLVTPTGTCASPYFLAKVGISVLHVIKNSLSTPLVRQTLQETMSKPRCFCKKSRRREVSHNTTRLLRPVSLWTRRALLHFCRAKGHVVLTTERSPTCPRSQRTTPSLLRTCHMTGGTQFSFQNKAPRETNKTIAHGTDMTRGGVSISLLHV